MIQGRRVGRWSQSLYIVRLVAQALPESSNQRTAEQDLRVISMHHRWIPIGASDPFSGLCSFEAVSLSARDASVRYTEVYAGRT